MAATLLCSTWKQAHNLLMRRQNNDYRRQTQSPCLCFQTKQVRGRERTQAKLTSAHSRGEGSRRLSSVQYKPTQTKGIQSLHLPWAARGWRFNAMRGGCSVVWGGWGRGRIKQNGQIISLITQVTYKWRWQEGQQQVKWGSEHQSQNDLLIMMTNTVKIHVQEKGVLPLLITICKFFFFYLHLLFEQEINNYDTILGNQSMLLLQTPEAGIS